MASIISFYEAGSLIVRPPNWSFQACTPPQIQGLLSMYKTTVYFFSNVGRVGSWRALNWTRPMLELHSGAFIQLSPELCTSSCPTRGYRACSFQLSPDRRKSLSINQSIKTCFTKYGLVDNGSLLIWGSRPKWSITWTSSSVHFYTPLDRNAADIWSRLEI